MLKPLKVAASIGVMMSDPLRYTRYCFTLLIVYMMDLQEAHVMACVAGQTSPVTMAMYRDFGDDFRHEPRTREVTFGQLAELLLIADLDEDIVAYSKAALK